MSTFVHTDTRQLVADLVEAWNAHDVEAVVAFHAAGFVGEDVSEAAPVRGRAGIRRSIRRYLNAFPDLRIAVERIVTQNDEVGVLWTARATHEGLLLQIPPTNREVELRGSTFLKLAEGGIIRSMTVWDVAGLLRAVGLLPALNDES